MFVKVKYQTRPEIKLLIPIDDDFSLPIDSLSHYFPGTNSLKYMDEEANEWAV